MIEDIFNTEWEDINEVISYVENNNLKYLGQGWFTKVYQLNDTQVLKINCGDPDYGFMEYRKYFIKYPSIHSPKCFYYKTISNPMPHYIMLTEKLDVFPEILPEPNYLLTLRELIEENLYDNNQDIDELMKIVKSYDDNIQEQIIGIYNFFKHFDDKLFNIDLCLFNLMLRGNTWIVNDPLVFINPNY